MKQLVLVALVAAGCGAGTRSPTGAVRALIDATQIGDRDQVLALLGPKTRERLVARAKLAGELSGRRQMKEAEMLGVGWGAPAFSAERVVVVERGDERARVEVASARGRAERFDCVRTVDGWKVELPE